MNELVIMKDKQAVTSSLQVAEVFEKNHRDVLEAIRTKTHSAENSAQYQKMFVEGTYKDKSGKSNKLYYMNRDGFSFIVMGFTGRKADSFKLRYIDAFNAMENELKQQAMGIPTSMSQALRLAADQAEKIEQMKPKVLFADAVETSHTSILVGELAKLLKQNGVEIGQNRLFKWLRENGYLIGGKRSDYNIPTQRSLQMGLFEIKERSFANPDGSVKITKTPKVTGKGQQYFINKFLA